VVNNISCGRDQVNPHSVAKILQMLDDPVRLLVENTRYAKGRLMEDILDAVRARAVGNIEVNMASRGGNQFLSLLESIHLGVDSTALAGDDARARITRAVRSAGCLTVPADSDRIVSFDHHGSDVKTEAG
jgi:hypothetical protein